MLQRSIVLFAFLLLLAPACKTTQKTTAPKVRKDATVASLVEAMKRGQLQAEWMDARARIDYAGEDMSVSGTAEIKWRKDSILWISVKKFGFEAARAQVTPDSIYVLDRLNNEYSVEPLSYIEQRFRLPARFDLLQSIFLGNPVFFTTQLTKETSAEGHYLTGTSSAGMQNEYWLTPGDLRLRQMTFTEEKENRSVSIGLDNYQPIDDNRQFAYLRQLALKSRQTGNANVTLEFKDVTLDVPTEFRFEVPARYTKKK